MGGGGLEGPGRPEGLEGLAILVASESLFLRHYFSYIFEKRHTLRLAASGREAIEQMAGLSGPQGALRPFDLVFVNEYLPDMGAAELLEKIGRSHPGTKSFVLLTHSNDARRLVERHGAAGVIMKPFTTSDVLKSIMEALPAGKINITNDFPPHF